MSSHRLLVVSLLLLATACGGESNESAAGPTSAAPAPNEPVTSTLHIIAFSRLQGFGEAVPCRGSDDRSVLAAASRLRDDLWSQGDGAWLVCIGDSTIQTALVNRSPGSMAAAKARSLVALDAMAAAGVDLYVPSHGDFFAGADELLEAARERGLTVLMTNVDAPDLGVETSAVLEHRGLRLAVFSAIAQQSGDPDHPDSTELTIDKPNRSVKQRLDESLARGEAHMTALFSNLSTKLNHALAESAANLHFIIGSMDTGLTAERPVARSGTIMLNMRTGGREVGHTTLRIVDGDFASIQDLSPLYVLPDEVAAMEEVLARYAEEHGTRDIARLAHLVMPGNPTKFIDEFSLLEENKQWIADAREYRGSALIHRAAALPDVPADHPVELAYARQGAAMHAAVAELRSVPQAIAPDSDVAVPSDCVTCHQEQHDHWAATDHARAFESLVEVGRELDSSCLLCHAAGFGDADGFSDPRLQGPFGGVTCYNCHFATKAHARSPRMSVDPVYIHADPARMMCGSCHTGRQHPGFDMDAALPTVSCPPLRRDDPIIAETLAQALVDIERREGEEIATLRDVFRKARVLLGLGRTEEGLDAMVRYARSNETDGRLAIEICDDLEGRGHSRTAMGVLRDFLQIQSQNPEVNLRLLELLLHATDEDVRDPEQVVRRVPLLVGPAAKLDSQTIPFKIVEVDALMQLDRVAEATALFDTIREQAPAHQSVREREALFGVR